MSKPLRISVYNDRYPTNFVTPRSSRHTLDRQRFLPLNLVSSELEGITLIEPALSVDLVHAFNRIPLNASKFMISFESHLPRQFALRRRGRLARHLLAPLRHEARRTAEQMFDAGPAGEFLDGLYERVALEGTSEPARIDPSHDVSSPERYRAGAAGHSRPQARDSGN